MTTETSQDIVKTLAALAHLLLKNDHQTEWLVIDSLFHHLKDHGLQLKGKSTEDLERDLRTIFQHRDEMEHSGIVVTAVEKRIDWDLLFCVRFSRAPYRPCGFEDTGDQQTACSD